VDARFYGASHPVQTVSMATTLSRQIVPSCWSAPVVNHSLPVESKKSVFLSVRCRESG